MKLSEKEFDRIVKRAIRRIPGEVRQYLDNLVISVRKKPSKEMLKDVGLPPGSVLLGLFQGVSLLERSVTSPPLFPDTIFLFQGPIEESCETAEELEEQVEITLVHEIAHFVGMTEERLEELGYG
ncbi:MAG TPA: metallopeptidase family protein [Syntrophorhabdaceae bacterium]|nr:metallopeptidase family protein [Syntrophorhabdaceae bacterium]HNT67540.1 metallopeptidase family protein [Syntrophorhabdaceae bacterium]